MRKDATSTRRSSPSKSTRTRARATAKPKARAGRSGTAGRKDVAKLAKMMAGIDFCMMTTQGARGSLHTRPMSNNGEVDFDGDVYFFSRKASSKVHELERDTHVSLSFVGGTKKAPVWIAVEGKADMIEDVEEKKSRWVDSLDAWFEKGPEDPNVVLIRVHARRASYWSYETQGEVDFGRR